MSLDADQAAVAALIGTLDRAITRLLTSYVHGKKHSLEMTLDVAKRIQTLEAAKATWAHYGHRALRLSKGVEVEP